MLTEEQHDLIREKIMNVNNKGEWKRETTWEGVKGRLKEMVKAAEELAQVGKDIGQVIEKEG